MKILIISAILIASIYTFLLWVMKFLALLLYLFNKEAKEGLEKEKAWEWRLGETILGIITIPVMLWFIYVNLF